MLTMVERILGPTEVASTAEAAQTDQSLFPSYRARRRSQFPAAHGLHTERNLIAAFLLEAMTRDNLPRCGWHECNAKSGGTIDAMWTGASNPRTPFFSYWFAQLQLRPFWEGFPG